MTTLKESKINELHTSESVSIERIKQRERARRLRAARALASRVRVMPDGRRVIVRFSHSQCLEHQVLIASFTVLALTGLLQRYSQVFLVDIVIALFGNIDVVRIIHHLAAVVFILQATYHLVAILHLWFVKRERGAMWPQLKDFKDLLQMVKFNLGITDRRPEFDRFTVEEKIEYWALLWGSPLMIITGIMMWFPITVTRILPGDAIPVARALHSWEALLATLAILIWHMYHTVIKERNWSIFNGLMSEEAMKHEHPLEYQRIMAACEYLQKMLPDEMNSANGKHQIHFAHGTPEHETA